jgi:hypothetical protein
MAAATRKVKPNTANPIHTSGRLCSQSLMVSSLWPAAPWVHTSAHCRSKANGNAASRGSAIGGAGGGGEIGARRRLRGSIRAQRGTLVRD